MLEVTGYLLGMPLILPPELVASLRDSLAASRGRLAVLFWSAISHFWVGSGGHDRTWTHSWARPGVVVECAPRLGRRSRLNFFSTDVRQCSRIPRVGTQGLVQAARWEQTCRLVGRAHALRRGVGSLAWGPGFVGASFGAQTCLEGQVARMRCGT